MRRALVVGGLLALAACAKGGALGEGLIVPPAQDGGAPVSDAGPDAGRADSGTPDAGPPDAGPPDAGPPDAGPDPHRVGGLGAGPWSTAPLTIYASAQGLLEAPISAGIIWFASGEVLSQGWRGPTYGLASWDGHRFMYIDPTRFGALEYNILELQALADGRLVLGFPTTGLLVWKPGDFRGHRLTVSDGLPGENIRRMQQDLMHDPPLLLVPTNGGLAVFRQVP